MSATTGPPWLCTAPPSFRHRRTTTRAQKVVTLNRAAGDERRMQPPSVLLIGLVAADQACEELDRRRLAGTVERNVVEQIEPDGYRGRDPGSASVDIAARALGACASPLDSQSPGRVPDLGCSDSRHNRYRAPRRRWRRGCAGIGVRRSACGLSRVGPRRRVWWSRLSRPSAAVGVPCAGRSR